LTIIPRPVPPGTDVSAFGIQSSSKVGNGPGLAWASVIIVITIILLFSLTSALSALVETAGKHNFCDDADEGLTVCRPYIHQASGQGNDHTWYVPQYYTYYLPGRP